MFNNRQSQMTKFNICVTDCRIDGQVGSKCRGANSVFKRIRYSLQIAGSFHSSIAYDTWTLLAEIERWVERLRTNA